jgi:hypothetical protein
MQNRVAKIRAERHGEKKERQEKGRQTVDVGQKF